MSTQLQREQLAQAYPIGTKVSGTVHHTPRFGVFVQLDNFPNDVHALLEIIYIPNLDYPQYPKDFPIGSRVEAWVLHWTEKYGQVYLTQFNSSNPNPRAFSEEKWLQLTHAYPSGTKVSGSVLRSTSFGVFVNLDEIPVANALIMVPHMLNYPSLRFPEDYPAPGARIEAYVLQWVEDSWNLSLTQLGPADAENRDLA